MSELVTTNSIKLSTAESYSSLSDTYHVHLCKGSYDNLLLPASLKDIVSNSSRQEHGIRVVVGTPKKNARNVSIKIVIDATTQDLFFSYERAFFELLTSGMVYLAIPTLNTVYKLVYLDSASVSVYNGRYGIFTVDFIEPNPTDRITINTYKNIPE